METEKEKTTNNTETVTISRAEYEALQAKLAAKSAELSAKTEELSAKTEELAATLLKNQWLMEQLKLTKKKLFGTSSEQMDQMVMEQFSHLFNEAEGWDAGSFVTETKVKSHTRQRRSGSVEDVVPEGTPVEVVEHRLSDEERICSICGTEMVEIGKEVHRSLKMKPAQFWVQEDVYYTYACKNCEQQTDEANIVKTPKEPMICPGSFASPEAVAYIATQKFVMYSPLYRLEQEFGRQGLKLSRQTMSNWLLHASDSWLQPIYDVLHRQLCQEKVLHGDETTLQVLRESGKAATSKSYMWLYRTSGYAEHPIVLYEYQPNRKAEHAETFLDGFSGWLHADGYQGYHKLPENIRVVGCWAHARRKFDEALNALDKDARKGSLAATGESYCSRLFQLETTFEDLTPEERYTKRLEQEKPVLDALLSWANTTSGKVAPKSALGKALHYLLEQWPYLIRVLEDGRLELSNNRAERSIKPFVMGRKNWLFANTPAGAQSSAVIYSLIETAKENGLDSYRYLLWVLKTAPTLAQTDETWAEKLIPACAPDICKPS
jgi:transposase